MRAIIEVLFRLLAFIGKELTETVRRPGAIASLLLGPFLIMALFGVGYSGVKRPLETVVVAPASSGLPSDAASYQGLASGGLHIFEVTADRTIAERLLADGSADVLIVAPEDPEARFRAGEQSVIEVVIDDVDPVAVNYAGFLASSSAPPPRARATRSQPESRARRRSRRTSSPRRPARSCATRRHPSPASSRTSARRSSPSSSSTSR